jgi:DNA-binding NtrC family response regulator
VASNRPLEREVAAGRFRADLFYRFNVVAFELPPLRERAGLIPAMARAMLGEFAARNGRAIASIAPEAMQAMLAHSWPGNVRELRNAIERAVALCQGTVIELDDLPEPLRRMRPAVAAAPAEPVHHLQPAPAARPGMADALAARIASVSPFLVPMVNPPDRGVSPGLVRATLAESRERTELSQITEALERNGHNRLRAAAELGISRMTLYKKLHKYGLMGA